MSNGASQGLSRLAHRFKSKQEILLFVRYSLVGSSGLVLAMGLLWVLVEKAGLFYIVASVISTEVGITNNFLWYEVWTFRDVKRSFAFKKLLGRWLRYNVVRVAGMGMGLAIVAGLVEGMRVHYLVANAVAIFVSIVFNYAMSIGWIWRTHSR